MPELPEVEATRAFAAKHVCGLKVREALVQEDTKVLQGKQPKDIRDFLEGHKITAVERKGKHFWCVQLSTARA